MKLQKLIGALLFCNTQCVVASSAEITVSNLAIITGKTISDIVVRAPATITPEDMAHIKLLASKAKMFGNKSVCYNGQFFSLDGTLLQRPQEITLDGATAQKVTFLGAIAGVVHLRNGAGVNDVVNGLAVTDN